MREIPVSFKVDATWFMNIGRDAPHTDDLNMADPNLGYTLKAQLSQNVPNPFYNYLTPDVFPGQPAQAGNGHPRQPAPAISAIRQYHGE